MADRGRLTKAGLVTALAFLACLVAAGSAISRAGEATNAGASVNPHAVELVGAFAAAYNCGDLETMMAHLADDAAWYAIDGDETMVMAEGADALRAELESYVSPDAPPRSAIEIVKSHGPFVTTLERAFWTVDGLEKSQAAFAVYEVEDDAIRRVWYFPASP